MADNAFPDKNKKRKRIEKLDVLNESIVSNYDTDGNPIVAEVNISRVKEDKTKKVVKSRPVVLEEHQETPENRSGRYLLDWDPTADIEAVFPHQQQQLSLVLPSPCHLQPPLQDQPTRISTRHFLSLFLLPYLLT